MKNTTTGVIGAGIAGLAAAVRLASHGDSVQVFEANAFPGGKLSQFQLGEYRFDAGPSLFTMPQYVDDLFRQAGEDPAEHFQYERLSVICHYFWEDGTRLQAYADPDHFAQEVHEKLGVPIRAIQQSLDDSRRKYELTGRIFLEKSLHRLDTWLDQRVLKSLLVLPTLDLFSTLNRVNERHLKHPKLVQFFNRYATYNGSDPYKAPGLLSIIPHFEQHIGAYFPKGGMHAITEAVYELARRKGVDFSFETPVKEVIVEQKRAIGLKTEGQTHRFDRIICNMDVFFAYDKLLPGQKQPKRILNQKKSTSALIFYWGIRKVFPELGLHNIFFSDNYREEFRHLAEGKVYEDPTVYINITSKCEAGDAPLEGENWFTMINVPFIGGQDWDAIIAKARKDILAKLSRILGQEVEPLIEVESLLEPRSIESRTASHLGALYGTSSNNRMAAFMRHPNFSRRIRDLYFCGGSVHPGGGIPLCLLSAKIVDELIAG
ncbi:MAG TPA: phytoene desaturase family protein [Saprospiraceae bacterium]|nr:phytoene desaturase family protein [Saprospiraceae bacterium]HMQ84817.1 phytoene desaturase family protein [Saprospiraceae bacterium]